MITQLLLILLVVDLFLWLLTLLVPTAVPFPAASGWLAWIAALLLTLFIVLPGVR